MSVTTDTDRFELPHLNLDYYRKVSFPAQEEKLSEALLSLCQADEEHRDDFIAPLYRSLDSYRFIGRCAGVEFPTELESRVLHALGIEE